MLMRLLQLGSNKIMLNLQKRNKKITVKIDKFQLLSITYLNKSKGNKIIDYRRQLCFFCPLYQQTIVRQYLLQRNWNSEFQSLLPNWTQYIFCLLNHKFSLFLTAHKKRWHMIKIFSIFFVVLPYFSEQPNRVNV